MTTLSCTGNIFYLFLYFLISDMVGGNISNNLLYDATNHIAFWVTRVIGFSPATTSLTLQTHCNPYLCITVNSLFIPKCVHHNNDDMLLLQNKYFFVQICCQSLAVL